MTYWLRVLTGFIYGKKSVGYILFPTYNGEKECGESMFIS